MKNVMIFTILFLAFEETCGSGVALRIITTEISSLLWPYSFVTITRKSRWFWNNFRLRIIPPTFRPWTPSAVYVLFLFPVIYLLSFLTDTNLAQCKGHAFLFALAAESINFYRGSINTFNFLNSSWPFLVV